MRKLKIFEHISLDGVIQNSPDENNFSLGDWTAPYRSPEGRDSLLALQGTEFDLLLGRRTYDMWAGYWPQAPSSPMADRLNAATKYVVTHRPQSLGWGPFEAVGTIDGGTIRKIKEREGADIILWGSSTLASPLVASGLVDEIVLIVYPVLLGIGKRLFTETMLPCTFLPVSQKNLRSGISISHYKFAGPMDVLPGNEPIRER